MDPTTTHALVAVTVGNTLGSATEMHYVHAKWKKSRVLAKLKQIGLHVTAVAWDATKVSESSSGYVDFQCRALPSKLPLLCPIVSLKMAGFEGGGL